jgi:uncharacterized protein (TIGR02996 family)
MTDEDGFLRKLLENPADDTVRLVYADWLEEWDDGLSAAKVKFLRAQHDLQTVRGREKRAILKARVRELARPLPTDWLAAVSHLTIENCPAARRRTRDGTPPAPGERFPLPIQFDYHCPKQWSELKPTDDSTVRYCTTCKHSVYYCDTIQEARRQAWQGRCVAIDCAIPRRPRDLAPPIRRLMGRMLPTDIDRAQRQERERLRLDEVSEEREHRKRPLRSDSDPE